jgi:microcystin-dependent protein
VSWGESLVAWACDAGGSIRKRKHVKIPPCQGGELSARFDMAVQSGTSAAIYTGNNSVVTPYPVPFPYLLASDVYVAVRDADDQDTVLQQGVDYTLTPIEDTHGTITGGSVVTTIEYDNTWTVTVFRQVSLTQLTELPEAGPISSRVLEKAYDKAAMALQQIHRRVLALEGTDDGGSVIVIPEGSTGDVLQDVQTFANTAARGNAIPRRVGQLGVQIDDGTLWRSIGTGAGSWARQITESVEQAAIAVASYTPPGVIAPFAGGVAPTGWLFCYGQAVSRTTYAALFASIGTIYGPGDGITTFAVPDMRGRSVFGKDDMGGIGAGRVTNSGIGNPGVNGAALGAVGGVDRHSLTEVQLPSHRHYILANVTSGNSILTASTQGAQVNSFGANNFNATIGQTSSEADVGRSSAIGSGEAHPNLPPAIILNYIIRT